LSLMACFADIVSGGSVATYARCSEMFNQGRLNQ